MTATVAATTAGAPSESISLSPAAQRIWVEGTSLEEFVLRLLEANLFHDAVRISAASLPPRDLVWWAALCIWAVKATALSPLEDETLKRAVRWIFNSSPQHHAQVVECGRQLSPESFVFGLSAAVLSFGFAPSPTDPLATSNLPLGRRSAQAAIFQSLEAAPELALKRYLSYFGLALQKTPKHWAA